MARPVKEIDQKIFEGLCGILCTKKEICGILGITDKTLDGWCKRTYDLTYAEVYEQKSAGGKIKLRRNQLKLSEKNASMAIWLGKQWLGQTDKAVVQVQELEKDPLSLALEALEKDDDANGSEI